MKRQFADNDWSWFARLRVGETVEVPEIGLPRDAVINAAQQFYRARHGVRIARKAGRDTHDNPVIRFTRTA